MWAPELEKQYRECATAQRYRNEHVKAVHDSPVASLFEYSTLKGDAKLEAALGFPNERLHPLLDRLQQIALGTDELLQGLPIVRAVVAACVQRIVTQNCEASSSHPLRVIDARDRLPLRLQHRVGPGHTTRVAALAGEPGLVKMVVEF